VQQAVQVPFLEQTSGDETLKPKQIGSWQAHWVFSAIAIKVRLLIQRASMVAVPAASAPATKGLETNTVTPRGSAM